jgi:hypothetical protein
MNNVGCSFGWYVDLSEETLPMADISSKDKSEKATLLKVGVSGSGGRFSMSSGGGDIHGDRKKLRLLALAQMFHYASLCRDRTQRGGQAVDGQ